jgi:GLPGLI family protein
MKNIRITILLFIVFCSKSVIAQHVIGEVEYRYRLYYNNIYMSLSFLSQHEKDRIMLGWNNPEGYSTRMKLQFSPEKSTYTFGEPYENTRYSYQRDEYIIENNLQDNTFLKVIDAMGKSYIIRDEAKPLKWRVMNEIREVAGYMCMKAVTTDPIKNQEIVAWFAANIPVSAGPEELYGLPGLILRYEVNDNHLIVEAEKVTLGTPKEPIALPAKLKGKEVTQQQFDDLRKKYIADTEKRKNTWVGYIRY